MIMLDVCNHRLGQKRYGPTFLLLGQIAVKYQVGETSCIFIVDPGLGMFLESPNQVTSCIFCSCAVCLCCTSFAGIGSHYPTLQLSLDCLYSELNPVLRCSFPICVHLYSLLSSDPALLYPAQCSMYHI